jgi:hypothetical protein
MPKRAIAWIDVHRWLEEMPEQQEPAGKTPATEPSKT